MPINSPHAGSSSRRQVPVASSSTSHGTTGVNKKHGVASQKAIEETKVMLNGIRKGKLAENFEPLLFDTTHILSYKRDEKFDSFMGKLSFDFLAKVMRGKLNVVPGEKRTAPALFPESLQLITLNYDEVQKLKEYGIRFVGFQYRDTGYPLFSDQEYSSMVGKKLFIPHTDIPKALERLCRDMKRDITEALANGNKEQGFKIAAEFNQRFMGIHPYNDGCGRTGRLITDRILSEFDLPAPDWEFMDRQLRYTAVSIKEYEGYLKHASNYRADIDSHDHRPSNKYFKGSDFKHVR